MAISRRAEPRQIPSVPNSDGTASLGCCRRGAACRMAPAAGSKVRRFDRGRDTDPTGRARVLGDNGEVVEVRQVDDTGMRVRNAADNDGVVCSRIRGSVEAPARLFRSHAAMVNVSQDVTPTEHPPAGIRIARSSDCPDLAQKADTATQKIKVLTEKIAIQPDGPLSKYTASHDTNPPFRYTKEDKHVGCRTSGAYEPPGRLPARDSISETAHVRCMLGAACAFWKKEARSARYGRSAIQAGATTGDTR